MKLDRANFRRLAESRIEDAKALLDNQRWDAAYYLTGYAVECGLKSCVIAKILATDEFPARGFSNECWTHDLAQLAKLAGLKDMLETVPTLNANWEVVKVWTEGVRYDLMDDVKARDSAEQLYLAVDGPVHGVLSWLRTHW